MALTPVHISQIVTNNIASDANTLLYSAAKMQHQSLNAQSLPLHVPFAWHTDRMWGSAMTALLGVQLRRGLATVFSAAFLLLAIGLMLVSTHAWAGTYVNASTTFNWIDASTHTKVGYNTVPYKFNGLAGCGTTPPVIDDTISDIIPLGFDFVFGDKVFDSIRIMTNGRIHFVSTTLPLDNTTCGYGGPVTQLPYPIASLAYTMRIYGNDMDPTLLADYSGNTTPCVNASTCYISYASIGSAPNRQLVVTWNNVPEWANSASATGNYNLQIIVNEGGDFIYQYGTDTPGPSAALGQVGWEVSTADFDTPVVGYPVPNTAIHFFIPHPVVEYLMEQPSWNGSGSVLDTSGNAGNGTPVGLAQTVAGGKVCRGTRIPATRTNAIDSGLSVPTAIGNSGTIAFWYQANTAWSGAGTQDALLLDATTVNNQWFFLSRRGGTTASGGGRLRFVITDSAGTARVVETAAITVPAATWKHIAVTWNFNNLTGGNNDMLTIYVDGVQQAQTKFTSTTVTLAAQIGSLYIGGTRNSLAGPSGTVNSADATLDEFRAYNYEAKQAFVSSIMNLNSGGCLNHYAIADAGTGLACQLSQFTFAAHTASHGAFVNNAMVTLSTSDGTGTWSLLNGHGYVTNIGSNTGNATYLYNNESQVLLGFTHSTAATVTVHVTDGTYSEQENTALVISNCAVGKFNACEVATPRCVPTTVSTTYANLYTKLADTAFALDVTAAKADGTLDTSFNKTVSVNLLVNTGAPTINASSNCPTSQVATIPLGSTKLTSGRSPVGGVSVAADAFSNVSPNYSAYRDVRVQFVCSKTNCGSAGTWCATDAFAVRPQSLTVASSANADSAGASATSAPVVKAGAAFTLTANAATAGYDGIPSIDASAAEWLTAPVGGRAAPGAGTVSGSPVPSVLSFATAAALATGNGASGNFGYDEVGYFRFKAGGVSDGNYVAISGDVGNGDCVNTPPKDYSNTLIGGKYGCKVANQTATDYFGRFIPDHFAVTSPLLTQACVAGGFSYMGQPFTQTASVEAQSLSGKTQNYSASFAKGTVTAQAENANNGTSLGARLTFTAPWSNGTAAFSVTQFSRPITATPDATWGPYDALSIGVSVADPDTVFLVNRDMDQTNSACTTDASGTSNGTCTAVTLASGAKFRFGRLRMRNVYGSELLALPVPMEAQYWAGSYYVTNAADSCMVVPMSSITMGNYLKQLNACETQLTPVGNVTMVAGKLSGTGLLLTKPGVNNAGSVDLAINVSAIAAGNTCVGATQSAATAANMPWLGPNLGSRATFGIYKSPLIYRRENY